MNKRPGHIVVTTEVGFCSFCGRPRNLRSEAHQLGTLVRTIVTCETCHRTLSSTIGVAAAQPEAEAEAVPAVAEPETAAEPEPAPAKPAPKRKPAAAKSTTTKTRATKKTK
jgi:hypothetical protein